MEYDLVFEGGGAKGMVFVGAMQEFETRGLTFNRLLGTSAGAITATLLAAGYDSASLLDLLNEKLPDGKSIFTSFMLTPENFSQADIDQSLTVDLLNKVNLPFIPSFIANKLGSWILAGLMSQGLYRSLFSLVELGGWYTADKFVDWMARNLNTGTYKGQPRNFGAMTLKEFYEATEVDLSLVASDTMGATMLVLNHRTTPDCPVVWAVRMSMSIPMIWQTVEWQSSWGKYYGHEINQHEIVDGGLLSNFPVELFISSDKDVTRLMGPPMPDNDVLGLLIDEAIPVPGAPPIEEEDSLVDLNKLRTARRIMRLANTMMKAHDKMVIQAHRHLVVKLPAGGYGTTEFDMTDARRNALVEAGRTAMKAHLDNLPAPFEEAGGFSFNTANSAPIDDTDQMARRILGLEN